MDDKIKINTTIVFMGSMNAMPMAYALEFKKMGYNVLYFVDAPKNNFLCRPEHHFPEIHYPYPPWIVEMTIPSQIFLPLFPKFFSILYLKKIRHLTKNKASCFILNGFFTSLTPFLPKNINKIGLSHGSDLDTWAYIENLNTFAKNFSKKSIFKYLPERISKKIIKLIISRQYNGYSSSDAICYFPLKFNEHGDHVIKCLSRLGIKYIPRYDISFELLRGQSREYKKPTKTLHLFSIVRFLFKTFPDGNEQYNKGNDIIIKGIAKYYSYNKNIKIDFFEKGEDVLLAKELCKEYGLDKVITWHKEMPFKKFVSLLIESDICFDQVGSHWIGAGAYAMWLGKPLIANDIRAVEAGVWPEKNPICRASSSETVYTALKYLENEKNRERISTESKIFVEENMSPKKAVSEILMYL